MRNLILLCLLFCCLAFASAQSCDSIGQITYNFVRRGETIGAPIEAADVVFLVDESGSMNTEHAWLLDVAVLLDEALIEKGVGRAGSTNRFALVTFGGRKGVSLTGKVWDIGRSKFGSPGQLRAAFSNLSVAGQLEDGYSAMNVALTELPFRENVARQFILITDENRDTVNSNLTYDFMLQRLRDNGIILNPVVNHAFHLNGVQAFGMDSENLCYQPATTAKMFVSKADCSIVVNSGVGTTYEDYVRLAHATGGAAWNLQQLRSGGETTVSFTKAFVAVKVKEVVTQVRECQVCRCQSNSTLACSLFTAESQEECRVTITTGTGTGTPPPFIGGNRVQVGESCLLNDQNLLHGDFGNRYVFSRSDFVLNPPSADVIFVVDESGSMRGEHLWLQETIYLLDDALRDDGIGEREPNRYGLVGFATQGRLAGSIHVLGDGIMGNTTEFASAINRLQTSGQVEDGYSAIATALEKFDFRDGNVARQLILVTDEDRDEMLKGLTSRKIRALLRNKDFRVNVVVNHNIEDALGNLLLGIDASRKGYIVGNGSSGYEQTPNASLPSDGGLGSTLTDYVYLALDSFGAAWDLNQLRRGGAIARAFTNAFVDAKRREITEQLKVCETCRCDNGELNCVRREDATSADLCFAPARCRLGRSYIEEKEWSVTYSITDQTGLAAMADVIVVVDESRSMTGEHKWLRDVIPELDGALKARRLGVDKNNPNYFGLVGYASNNPGRNDNMGTILMVNTEESQMMGTAEEFRKTVRLLHQVGRYEDGYSAIMRALDGAKFREGAARLVILVTDEDRDVLNKSITFDVVHNALKSQGIVLNAVINQGFSVSGKSALGMDGSLSRRGYLLRRKWKENSTAEITYKAKRGGAPVRDSGYGTTGDDYARLALNTSGGAWDLNKLRKGGETAIAFTRAFVAVKVKEAVSQLKRCRVCQCIGGNFQCQVYSNVSKVECKDIERWVRSRGSTSEPDPQGRILPFTANEDVTPLVQIYPPSIDVCPGDGFTANCSGVFYNGYSGTVNWVDVPSNGIVTMSGNGTQALLDVSRADSGEIEYQCRALTNQWTSTALFSANVVENAECEKNCVKMYGDGYALIRRGREATLPFTTSFKFCPSTVVSGTLYCLENFFESGCTHCLVLNDGDLELRWDCCLERDLRYSSSDPENFQALSPSNCYNTFVTITENAATLTVDSVQVTAPLALQCSSDYKPSRGYYLGGGSAGAVNGYNGCMTDVKLDEKDVLFHDLPTPSPSVRIKRPAKVQRVRRCTSACTGAE